jgi:hypothetical protein
MDKEKLLEKIAVEDPGYFIRLEAIKIIVDPDVLKRIALNKDDDEYVKIEAIKKITDQKVLEEIALNDDYFRVRNAVIGKLKNQEVLEKVALDDADELNRHKAMTILLSTEFNP